MWAWSVAGALVVVNALVFVLLLFPARGTRVVLENRVRDLERNVQSLQREARSNETLVAAMREAEEFAQGFPRREELVGLMERLTKLAGGLALHVPDTAYRPTEVKETGLTKVTVQMGVEGTYERIRRFLYELEGMRRFLVIEQLSLRDLKGAAALQVQLQFNMYLR